MTVAWFIVNGGQRAVLPEALRLAQKQVSDPASAAAGELQYCVQMLLNYGDDRQFETLIATMRRLKRENEKHYRDLWGRAAASRNKRILRLAAILIDDRRPGFGSLRYCDVAAGMIQVLSGEKFGIAPQMSLADRDRAVARAAAWLDSHRGGP